MVSARASKRALCALRAAAGSALIDSLRRAKCLTQNNILQIKQVKNKGKSAKKDRQAQKRAAAATGGAWG
jgi:hypothetical protein